MRCYVLREAFGPADLGPVPCALGGSPNAHLVAFCWCARASATRYDTFAAVWQKNE